MQKLARDKYRERLRDDKVNRPARPES